MPESLTLTTTLEPRGPAGAIVLTDDQVAQLADGKKAFPVRVTIGDTVLALRLSRMGGDNLIGFSKAVRAEAGVELGDELDVVIELDEGPREIDVPQELASLLGREPDAQAAWDALAPSRRKEHARSISEAKKPETKDRRIERVMDELRGK